MGRKARGQRTAAQEGDGFVYGIERHCGLKVGKRSGGTYEILGYLC